MKTKFDDYRKQIKKNKFFYRFFGYDNMVMKYYEKAHGYRYDINNPVTFTEKINSRKLENNPLYTICADKIKVREYVKNKIGEQYLIPCILTCKKLTSKLYDTLPKSFVLKTSSGSGTIEVVFDKDKADKKEILALMKEYQKIDFAYIWGEMFYKKIPNYIICEELLTEDNKKVPNDYKFHVFKNNGDTKIYCQVDTDRFSNHCRNIYDENFKKLDLTISLDNTKDEIKKPKNWDEMIKISKKLAEDFEYVRVDLYSVNNKIYFGELTFTHGAGLEIINPDSYNKLWGSYWK